MRNTLIVTAALGALGLFAFPLSGCGGSTSGSGGSGGSGTGGGSGGSVTAEAACTNLSKALCDRIGTCFPFLLEVGYGDAATCATRVVPKCTDTIGLAGVKTTAQDIQTCADAYAAATCDDVLSGNTPAACIFAGDKADGATCATGPQCSSGICKSGTEGACGACLTPVAEGAACDNANKPCAAGLYCATSMTCKKPVAKGGACSPDAQCAAGLSCNSGVCASQLPEGGDCSAGQSCDFNTGLLCNSVSKKCEKVPLAKLGETCGFDQATGAITLCVADVECDFQQNKCIAKLKEGDACTVDAMTGSSHCETGYQCVAGKCSAGFPTCN